MQIDQQALRALISDEDRLLFRPIPPEYQTDALGRLRGEAGALAFPLSAQEVSGILA